jgi:hypothetical protein
LCAPPQGRRQPRQDFEGEGAISRAELVKKSWIPTYYMSGGHETEHAVFIIVIKTSNAYLQQMKLQGRGLCDYYGETETVGRFNKLHRK